MPESQTPLPTGGDPGARAEIDRTLEQHARDQQAESVRQAGITRRMAELEERMRSRMAEREQRGR